VNIDILVCFHPKICGGHRTSRRCY